MFLLYSSVVLSTFKLLCSATITTVCLQNFFFVKLNLCPLSNNSHFLSPYPVATIIYFLSLCT